MAGIAGSLLTTAAGVGRGVVDRRFVFQFPAEGIHSHVLHSVPKCSWGLLASSISVRFPSLCTAGRMGSDKVLQ